MKPLTYLILVVMFASVSVRAELVSRWISTARSENSDILKARAQLRAALARVPQARSLQNPSLELETMGSNALGSSQMLRLTQAFPWPGTLGQRESAASLQARAYWHEVQAVELRVAARIRSIASEIAYLQKAAALLRQNLTLFEKQEDFLEQASRGGGEVSDLVRVEMESGLLRDDLAQNQEMIRRQRFELEALIGVPLASDEVERVPPPAARSTSRDRKALVARLDASSPMLQALRSRIDAARAGVTLARLETLPEFMVSAGYRRAEESEMNGNREVMNEAALMFSMSLPVWRKKNRGVRDEAAAMLELAVQEHASASRMLHSQLDTLLSRERDAARRAVLFQDRLLPKARQAHEAVEASYRAGSASLLDVFDSRRRLLDTETGYWRAIADRSIQYAEIDALFGTEIQTPFQ